MKGGEGWYMNFCVQSAERSGQGWLDSSQGLHDWEFVRVLCEDRIGTSR